MANSVTGKFCSLVFLSAVVFSRVLAGFELDPVTNVSRISAPEINVTDNLNRQHVQLDRLEELVRNLSRLVSRLQSKLEVSPKVRGLDGYPPNPNPNQEIVEMKDGFFNGENAGAVSVTMHNPFWSERFQFVSAVKLHSNATSINILPFRDFDGLSKYIAVGNEHGRVYVILRNGDVLIDFDTNSDSSVTSMLSYTSAAKNESVLITGHKNGMILIHRVWEEASNYDEWSSLSMNNVGRFHSDSSMEINMLELHYMGRMRYILSSDANGTIRVFLEDGTVYGLAFPKSMPLAFLKQRLLFLTKSGAGSLDLRSMRIRESECEGLNHSSAISYTFDPTDRSKAYGVTKNGDLIHTMLLGDAMNFKCRARVFKRKSDSTYPRFALQAIRGYLLIINPDNVSVYNVSSQHYVRTGGPRLLFVASINEIRHSFPHPRLGSATATNLIPLVSSDREKLVVLGLGGGYVGMFRSNLPVHKPESNTILWTSPVFFFILFLFGAWHFFAKKKDALTSWGPDDPFTLSPVNGDSSLSSSRVLDGGGGLRGSSRRYNSPPPRFSSGSGAAGSFRPSSGGGGAIDPRVSEMKYRGASVEQAGLLHKRRESLFGHNLVIENNNDRIS